MDYLSSPISAFASAQATTPIQTTLEKVLFSTKNIDLINKIRSAPTKDEKSALKKQMPAATISGTFTKRNAQGLIQYNGLICLDFDGQDNDMSTDEMKSIVCAWPQTLYAGLSVGGKGIFVIIPTNLDDHTWHGEMCDVLGQTIQKCGLVYDKACKDITRLRFLSHDINPYVNRECHLFDAKRIRQLLLSRREEEMSRPQRRVYTGETLRGTTTSIVERVELYVRQIERSAIDICEGYADWIAIALSLSSEFGSDGEDFFVRISAYRRTDKKPEDIPRYYAQLAKDSKGKYSIKTFFHMCHKNGIKI